MDITGLVSAVIRRWYVVVPLVLLTLLGVVQVGNRVAPEYQANGSVLFYAPPDGSSVSNPFSSPVQAATALSVVMSGGSVRSQIADRGLESGYEVEVIEARPGTASAIVSILVRAGGPDTATETRDALVAQIAAELDARQAAGAVPEAERTRMTVLVSPENVSTIATGPLRAQIVVLVLGLALSFLFVVCLDEVLADRRRRQDRRRGVRDSEGPPADGPQTGGTAPAITPRGEDGPVPAGARSRGSDALPSH